MDNDQEKIEQLRTAIATLESQRETLGEAVVEASLSALRKQLAELEQETEPLDQHKKLVSLLFVDVVGSTQFSRDLEPEEILEIMDGGLRRLAIPIEQYGGRVTRFMGDGFKAVFGDPVTQENDAEMAVRAGLAILEDSKAYAAELEEKQALSGFNIRVGVNTGMVAVGGFTEAEDTLMGLSVNLGARLEKAAPPGGLLISHTTYQHVRGLFEIEALESITAKGFAEPVKVYLVRSSMQPEFRPQTRGFEGVFTPMIGRDAELKRLQDAFYTAVEEEETQTVTIIGEAGVGKSRLLEEFEIWSKKESDEALLYKGRCSPATQAVPYALLRDLFSRQFNIHEDDNVQEVHRKFEQGVGDSLGRDDKNRTRAHFIGQLLGFDFNNSPYLQGVIDDAQQLRDRAWIYMTDYLRSTLASKPVIIFLEDIHWADDSSLEVVTYLAQSLPEKQLMCVCLARPVFLERRPLWGEGQKAHTRIDLHPLSRRDGRHLVEKILNKMGQVPLALRELVVNGADGNPFYIEELIKMLIDSGVIKTEGGRWEAEPSRLAELLVDMNVPTTLTSLLQARLDTLTPEEKMVLQQASVAGRTFWDDLLIYINAQNNSNGLNQDEIPDLLGKLRQKEMIFHREKSALRGAQEYIFKHAVLRDVVYDTILKKVRRHYHAMVANWLIQEKAERAGELTGMIGEHLELAGQTSQAVTYLRQAGELAARQYANEQALNYLSRALELTPQTEVNERFAILLAREQVYSLLGARQSQNQDLEQLVELVEIADDDVKRAQVELLLAVQASEKSEYQQVLKHSENAIQLAEKLQQPQMNCQANILWGRALLSMGEYSDAELRFNETLSIAEANQLPNFNADSLRYLGIVAERLGSFSQAIEHYQKSLNLYREIGDRRGEGKTLNQLGNILFLQGDHNGGKQYYDQFLSISREIGDRWGEGQVVRNIGDIYLSQYDYRGASKYFEEALDITRQIGNRTIESSALVGLGNVYLEQAEYTKAKSLFEQSLNIAREIGNKPWEAKTLNQIGLFFHRLGDYVRAKSYYEQSIEIFQQLGNRLSQSRVQTDLSLLYNHLGDDTAAEDMGKTAFLIVQEVNHPRYLARAQAQLARAQLGLGKIEEAIGNYLQAKDSFTELGQDNLSIEVLAGLASAYLVKEDQAEAMNCVEQIISHLGKHQAVQREAGHTEPATPSESAVPGLEGTSDPLWIYFACYQVLNTGKDERQQGILSSAYNLIEEQAAKIEDADLRYSFLNHVKVNREISSEYKMGETA